MVASDKPWGQFSEADYSPAQWRRACLIHLSDSDAKDQHKLPVREPSGALNRNAVHAAAAVLAGGRGGVQAPPEAKRAAARQIVGMYRNDLNEDPPESLTSLAGMAAAGRAQLMPNTFMRSFPLENIEIKRSGDGRTVEAYAAVFDREAEIVDHEGHYREVIDRSAFNKAVKDASPQGSRATWNVGVFYNHGLSIHGTPADRYSLPLGTCVDIRPETRGLLTVTRYANTPLADEVLELINAGAIQAQSFTGRIVRSDPSLRSGQRHRPTRGELPLVHRTELGLREYGPTPLPAYADAAIVGVRMLPIMQQSADLDDDVEDTDVGTPAEDAGAAAEAPPPEQEHASRHDALVSRIRAARILKGMS